MRQLYFFLFFISFSSFLSAQYTDQINSNRPGASIGAFSVGTRVIQFEAGTEYRSYKHKSYNNSKVNGKIGFFSLRYGFFKEQLELTFEGVYQFDDLTNRLALPATKLKREGFLQNFLGLKYLVYDPYIKRELNGLNLLSWKANNRFSWDELIPAISIYAGANFDSANNAFTPEDPFTISPKVSIQTQNNFKSGFVLVTNIIADRFTTQTPTYGYIVTLTYCISDWFSLFAEKQGFDSDFYADNIVRFGAAALITKDWQVDASLLYSLKDTPSRTYGRIGVSYRFDFHDSDEFLEEKGKAGREIKKVEREKAKREKRKKKDYFEVDDDNNGL